MEVMVLYRETTIEQYIRLRETGNVGYLDFDIEELRSLPLDTVRRIAYDFLPLLQHNPYADYDLIPQTILEAMALYCDIDEELVRKLARTGDDGICTSLCWNKRVLLSTRRSIADHGSETVRGHFIYGELYDEIHDEHTSPERLRRSSSPTPRSTTAMFAMHWCSGATFRATWLRLRSMIPSRLCGMEYSCGTPTSS